MKIGMEMSKFEGRKDTMKLIEALEGLELKAGPDFPQGDKTMRKADHQAFLTEFIYEVHGGTYKLLDAVPKNKTLGAAGLHVPCGVSTRGTGARYALPGDKPGSSFVCDPAHRAAVRAVRRTWRRSRA